MKSFLFISALFLILSTPLYIPNNKISRVGFILYDEDNPNRSLTEGFTVDSVQIQQIVKALNGAKSTPIKFIKRYEIHIYYQSQKQPLVIYGSGESIMIGGKTYRLDSRRLSTLQKRLLHKTK